MKTELIYLWINKDPHGCFQQEGFNLSPKYHVSYSCDSKELKIDPIEAINVFQSNNIANVTAIIGENGTGKTTLLKYLTTLDDVPLTEETREEYTDWHESQNELHEFIAVYVERESGTFRIINLTPDTFTNDGNTVPPYSVDEFRNDDYIGKISHVYLSNGAYCNSGNMRKDRKINHITISDSALPAMFREFYCKKYGASVDGIGIADTPFNALANMLASQETSQTSQALIDLVFYLFLNETGGTFRGKKLNYVLFSVKSALKKIKAMPHPISYPTRYAQEEHIACICERYCTITQSVSGEGIWRALVCNFAFELLFVFEEFASEIPAEGQQDADLLFGLCVEYVNRLPDDRERNYYKHAIDEIQIVKSILVHAEMQTNLLPENDLGREIFAKINMVSLKPLVDHIQSSPSFILKYLDIRNFELSSGERALLNLVSRLYFTSQMDSFFEGMEFGWNDSILLLIDEIDLYLHPEWQRQIIKDLLDTIKTIFPENYFQIIITSHSPIILSDIPKENAIFLRRNTNGKIIQDKHHFQTFGANIYTLYRDAFFIENGLAMGEFAKETINSWILEIKAGGVDPDGVKKKSELIGEPIIRKRLEKLMQERGDQLTRRIIQQDERQRILGFLREQKANIQHQIDILEGRQDD